MMGFFLTYDIVSIVFGGASTVAVLVLWLKTGNPRLPPFLWSALLVSLVSAVLSYELFCDIVGAAPRIRGIIHEGQQLLCLGLCITVPRAGRPHVSRRFTRPVERGFAIGSILIALAFLAILLVRANQNAYIAIYGIIYADLTLAVLYFGIGTMIFHRDTPAPHPTRNYARALTVLRIATIALFPAIFVVDFFGWMIPWLAVRIPPGLSVLPLLAIVMSCAMVAGSIKDILDPEPDPEARALSPDTIRAYGLTKREAEIVPLAVELLSYREIGERLFISVGTVRTHLIHIYQKTGARSRLELARTLRSAR